MCRRVEDSDEILSEMMLPAEHLIDFRQLPGHVPGAVVDAVGWQFDGGQARKLCFQQIELPGPRRRS